jgi:hypothetical protein
MAETLLEIVLSNWTPSAKTATYNYVRIFAETGKIYLSQCPRQNMWQAPVKLISERVFTPLELGFLKQNLETVKKSSMSFTFSFAPLGFEYELEKCVLNFERFLITQFEQMSAEYRDCVLDLKSENESLQKGMDQLQRNCKTYKYEINELAVDYNRLFDKSLLSKNIELMTKNKQLEDLLQKEKFEKEQFIAYCNSLNEKLMELTTNENN